MRSGELEAGDGLDGLVRRAAAGDSAATGEFLAQSLPYLMGAARKIAPLRGAEDHEDMVHDACLKLLAAWSSGGARIDNPRGYLVATMRNAFIDELRSPRSRVEAAGSLGLAETGEDIEGSPLDARFADHPELRVDDEAARSRIDAAAERALVRDAFERLRPEARSLLAAVLVEGRGLAELSEEQGRSAAAISSSLMRAKQALRRSVLIVMLSEGGPECAADAERLPERVLDDPDAHRAGERGLAHARGCERCRSNWRRFAALAAAFGIVPLFAVDAMIRGARPALAADPDPHAAADRTSGIEAPAPSVVSGRGSSPVLRAFAAPWVLALSAALVFAAGALVAIDLVRAAGEAGGAVAGSSADTRADPGTGAVTEVDQSAGGREYATRFEVSASREGESATLRIDFAVLDAPEWSVGGLRLELPDGAVLTAADPGWSCAAVSGGTVSGGAEPSGVVVCEAASPQPGPAVFSIGLPAGTAESATARFSLAIEATASETTGRAPGAADPEESSVNKISGRARGDL